MSQELAITFLIVTLPGALIALSEIVKPNKEVGEAIILYTFPIIWIAVLLVSITRYTRGLQ